MVIVRAIPGPVGIPLGPDGFHWCEHSAEPRIQAPMALAIGALATGDVWHAASACAATDGRASLAQASLPIPQQRSEVPALAGRLARRAVTKS